MDKHNSNFNNSDKSDLDSTKKFNIDEILNHKSDTASPSDIPEFSQSEFSDNSFENSSKEYPDDSNEIFEEIFDSHKKTANSFDDTFDDFSYFTTSAFSEADSENSDNSESPSNIVSSNDKNTSDSAGNSLRKDKTPEKKKKKFFNSTAWLVIRTILLIFLCTAFICTTALVGFMYSLDDEINIELEALRLNYSSIVYYMDENGNEHEYERLFATQNRTWVNLEDIPEHLQNAAIAIEDHRFREHSGVDWKRTLSACFNMFFKTKSDFGASTITQQLVKNLTGDNQDSVKRKLQEIMRALYLEDHYDKDTILELYLNTIFLGEGCYGVGTAARTYFGKDVSDLTIAESAAIIGITNLPTYYNPYIYPENNRKRCNNIINRMYSLDMISKQERDEALNQELVFNTEKRLENSREVQSYFVDQIIEELIVDLTEECGFSKSVALHMIYSGGLKIYSTVNPEIQAAMDEIFEDDSNFAKYKGTVQPECAMVLMDPQNGDVVALRGGRGKKAGARVLNRATQSKRPPGSTIKPISVYAPAIEYGLITPFSVEDDAPIIFFDSDSKMKSAGNLTDDDVSVAINPGQAGKCYPYNEDDTFSGRTNILNGVKKSLNTISMRTLNKLGVDKSYNFLNANLGMSTLSPKSDKNLAPLALGQLTNGATVLDMAAAYTPFANGGTYYEPRLYTKVIDNKGNVLIDKTSEPVKAMSEKTSTYMHYMLQQVVESGTGTKARLDRGMPAAAKTGTSTGNKDRWFVGYTPYYVGATWFGYDSPAYLGTNLSQALTTWKKVMNKIHAELEVVPFEKNEDFKYVNICSKSGLLPNEHCYNDPRGSQVIAGYFHKDDVPKKRCNVHESFVIDTTTNMIASEFCPEENKKEVVLMKLNRYHNVTKTKSRIILGDEQYVIHSDALPSNMFRFSGAEQQAVLPGKTCTAHTEPIQIVDPEPEETPEETTPENTPSEGSPEELPPEGTDPESTQPEGTNPENPSNELPPKEENISSEAPPYDPPVSPPDSAADSGTSDDTVNPENNG